MKLQDLQAMVRSLVQQALSVPGTTGIGSMAGRSQPSIVVATPVVGGSPKEAGVSTGWSKATPHGSTGETQHHKEAWQEHHKEVWWEPQG